jgi:hypothetical protein
MEDVEKLDLKQQYKHLYLPSAKEVQIVDVPELTFLMIDGAIEPGSEPGLSPGFAEAMQALYGAAYTLKFMSRLRKDNPIDWGIMALEGLWWVASGEFDINRKDNWLYTLIMLQPDHITGDMFADALQQLRKKKGDQPAFSRLRLERWREGLSVQIMHIGPYADEPATVARMHAFAAQSSYRLCGKHHEIYMGDPRRGDPAKMKTVLRHAIEKAT